jgi:hypothetical protein
VIRTALDERVADGRIDAADTMFAWGTLAGADTVFVYSAAHINYIRAARQNRVESNRDNPFWLFCPDEVVLRPGDLICENRKQDPLGPYATFTCTDLLVGPGHSPHSAAHSDIVTEITDPDNAGIRYALGIGGNKESDGHYVGDAWVATNTPADTGTVGRERYRLDAQGRISLAHSPHVFAILRIRDSYSEGSVVHA